MQTEMEAELTPIQRFYLGRSVFITGVTGFVGKVLLEKLLRCCPGIGMLYLLVRPKRGMTSEERMDRLFDSELFEKVKARNPQFRRKIQLVDGDIMKPRLGISDEDLDSLKENVSIIFHSAARVQFNDPIRVAVEHNLKATKSFLGLCHELPNIVAVVHVSTSYVKREPDCSVLEEIPKTKITPKQLLDALEWVDPETEKAIETYLLEGKLTTYLVTKALGEVVVDELRGDLPTAIIRPCNISPTWRDPFPGWVDTIQGISGLLLAGAKGVLRTLLTVPELKLQVIPVDIVANSIVVGAWYVAETRPAKTFVVNSVMEYDRLPFANEEILRKVLDKRSVYPLSNIYRYPDFTLYYNYYAYKIHSIIDEWIPAYIIDTFLYIFTGQTVLVRVYKKINFVYNVFLKIGRTPWICRLENYNTLKESLSDEDAEMFYLDMDSFDWDLYMDHCLFGGRKLLAHEDPANIPYAQRKSQIWLVVSTILKWIFILLLCYYFLPNSLFRYFGKDEDKVQEIYS